MSVNIYQGRKRVLFYFFFFSFPPQVRVFARSSTSCAAHTAGTARYSRAPLERIFRFDVSLVVNSFIQLLGSTWSFLVKRLHQGSTSCAIEVMQELWKF